MKQTKAYRTILSAIIMALLASPSLGGETNIFTESFEDPVVVDEANNDKPSGWDSAGHPSYTGLITNNFTTPYGVQAVRAGHSTGTITTKATHLTNTVEIGATYTLTFNVSGRDGVGNQIGEYRAQLLAIDGATVTVLGEVTGDSTLPNDMSYSNNLEVVPSSNAGERLAIRLGIDPDRANWQNVPIWDNLILIKTTDETPPTLASSDITDNSGNETNDTYATLTYTLTFNEEMDADSITTSDFSNSAGSPATITVNSISQPDTNVFTVVVTPTAPGDLVLRVSSNVTDLAGNSMNDNVDDDTTIEIILDPTPPVVDEITSDMDGETSVDINLPITYTVTFDEAMDTNSFNTTDFVNGASGGATITVDSISPYADTNITVVVTPTTAGDIVLRVNSGSVTNMSGVATDQDWDDATTNSVVITPPTVTSISSDKDAGAETDLPITYTVTFSEVIDASTAAVGDFTNAVAGAAITVDSVSPGTDTNVFTVVVTPNTVGNLQLQVKSGSVDDLSGNTTTTDYDDDTTITVTADTTPPEVSSFSDDTSPNAVAVGGTVTYTVTFNEPVDGTTVETTDFSNASNATISVTSVSPATDTNVFTVAVSPTSTGGLQLRLLAVKVVDLSGNTNDVAFTDDTVITVVSSSDQDGIWNVDSSGNWSEISNWLNSLIADGTNYTATLGNVITADRTITLDTDRTIGNITASDTSHNYTIAGGNTLTLDRTSGTPTVSVPNNRTLTISSAIDGSNGVAKTGSGTLIMNGANTFTGDIDLSAGRIQIANDANEQTMLGAAGNTLTFTGNATLHNNSGTVTLPQNITINNGITANVTGAFGEHVDVNGVLAGSGTLYFQGSSAGPSYDFFNTGNTFSGPIKVDGGSGNATIGMSSLNDAAASSGTKISLASDDSNGGQFFYKSANASLVLNNYQFELIVNGDSGSNFGRQAEINNSAATAYTMTINNDLVVTGTGTKNLVLAGSNTGDNTFAGDIPDGSTALSIYKDDSGKWILSGENTYTGTTTVKNGTLVIAGQYTLADSGTLNIAGGKVEISTVERIDNLQFNGTPQADGRWGSTASAADNQDDTRFTGTGILYVNVDLPATGSVFRFK